MVNLFHTKWVNNFNINVGNNLFISTDVHHSNGSNGSCTCLPICPLCVPLSTKGMSVNQLFPFQNNHLKWQNRKKKKTETFFRHANYFLLWLSYFFLLPALNALCLRVWRGRLQGQQLQPQGTLRRAEGSGFLLCQPPRRPCADRKFVKEPTTFNHNLLIR